MNISQLKHFAFSTFFLLSACASPMAKIEPKVTEFKKNFPDHFETFKGINWEMRYAWSGDPAKPPLIFVHGSPGGWEAWAEFLLNKNLQERFHVLAVDRPGYGGSDGGRSELSLKRQAEDVMSILRFNKSGKKAILVGHSYGGAVIAQIAVDMPERISSLIFVASSVDPELERKKWFQYPASWWPICLLIPNDLRVCNEEIMALKQELETLKPRWKEIKASVGTIQGNADDLVPPGNQDYILSRIPASQVKFMERVSGMNHFVPWDHPELILNAISKME